MGGWIKVNKGLWDHPKIVRTASALNADIARTLGAYIRLWSIADEHTTDGRLEGYTSAAVDGAVGVTGFAQAAADAGWLEIEAQAVVVPRFHEHNGQSAKRRAQETERKSLARKASASDADAERPRADKRRNNSIDRLGDRSTNAGGYERVAVDQALFDAAKQDLTEAKKICLGDRQSWNLENDEDRADRESVIRVVLVARRWLPPGECAAILSRVKQNTRRGQKERPPAYLKGAFAKECKAHGVDFHQASSALVIPPELLRPAAPPCKVERVHGRSKSGSLSGHEVTV
jgi:hypothetical protein